MNDSNTITEPGKKLPYAEQTALIIDRNISSEPDLKKTVKLILNRYYLSNKNSICSIHELAKLKDVHKWAGLETCTDPVFFGYNGKCPWSADQSRMIMHRFDGKDLRIILLEKTHNRCLTLAITPVWNWRQGAMVQWKTIDNREFVIYNTIRNGTLGSAIVDCENIGQDLPRFIPWPIQAIHPMVPEALSINYRRLNRLSRAHGYSLKVDNLIPLMSIDNDGIWRFDLLSGEGSLIVSLRNLLKTIPGKKPLDQNQFVNHVIYSPSGKRFGFLHRYSINSVRATRLMIAERDGSGLRTLLDCGHTSHYQWDGDEHVVVYARCAGRSEGYYRINVTSAQPVMIGSHTLRVFGDGHCSLSPDRRFLVTDTYPDKNRIQKLILFDILTSNVIELGKFSSPGQYKADYYCGLHPRWSRCGQMVSFDSAFTGIRQSYVLEITSLIAAIQDGKEWNRFTSPESRQLQLV